MSALTRFVFRTPDQGTDAWSIVQWWEVRRPAFNLAVGAAGALTMGTVFLFELLLADGGALGIPWLAVVAYGVMANLCYTLGPAVDALVCCRWGPQYAAVGPALFRYGFVFAVGLTLLPLPFAVLSGLLRLIFAVA